MKKRYLIFLLSLLTLGNGLAQNKFVLSGTMTNDSLRLTPARISTLYLLKHVDGHDVKVDSTTVVDKKFRFEGIAPEYPEMYFISGFDNGTIPFFAEPGEIEVEPFSAQFPISARAKGTPNNDVFRGYKDAVDRYISQNRNDRFGQYSDLPDSIKMDEKAFLPYQSSNFHGGGLLYKTNIMRYLKDHLDSPVALYLIRYDMFYMFTPKVIERQFLRAVSPELHNHPLYSEIVNQLKAANLAVGNLVPEFDGNDLNGKVVKLSDLKGKYVLIDFWASWCAPCRREFPYLKQAMEYSETHDNFVILSYSLDDNEKDWKDCIRKNELVHQNWIHISSLKGWSSPVVSLFNITGVPHTILINPDGKVIAFDLRREDMLNKVKKLMDEVESYE